MYASNRYEREMMRIPQNYSGNAFLSARQRENVTEPTERDLSPDREDDGIDPSCAQEQQIREQAPLEEATEQTASVPQPEKEDEQPAVAHNERERSARSGAFSLLRDGLGQEELMLLGLLYLLRSDGERGHNDELVWLLLLLLLMG